MRSQVFDPGFLFDFYSDRGSTATPSARSNVSWCGLRIFSACWSFWVFFQIWSPMEYRSRSVVVLPSIVLFRTTAFKQSVFPPFRALVLCALAWKLLKMDDFSKTGSRNMAETCPINFLTLVSYSTSIVIGGLRRLHLAVLMWAGVDLEYFLAETARCSFRVFLAHLIAHGTKTIKARVLIIGTQVELPTLYSNWTKSSANVDALRR